MSSTLQSFLGRKPLLFRIATVGVVACILACTSSTRRKFGASCGTDTECETNLCLSGFCSHSCTTSDECEGSVCVDNACQPGSTPAGDTVGSTDVGPDADAQTYTSNVLSFDLGPSAGSPPKGDDGMTCEEQCSLNLTVGSARSVGARLLNAQGLPIPNAMLGFVLKAPSTSGLTIGGASVATDENGRASTVVTAGSQAEVVTLVVHAVDQSEVAAIEYRISVAAKGTPGPSITPQYVGSVDTTGFGAVNLRLIPQVNGAPSCAKLDLFETSSLPKGLLTSPDLQLEQPWHLPSALAVDLPADGSPVAFTVIGLGWAKGAGTATHPLIGGCADAGYKIRRNPQTQAVEGDAITIQMAELPPRLMGVYDFTLQIDLFAVMPDSFAGLFAASLDLLADPVAGALSLVCGLSNTSVQEFCLAVFTNPAKPAANQVTAAGGQVVGLLKVALSVLVPTTVAQTLAASPGLSKIVSNFTVEGTLELNAEPDGNGVLTAEKTLQTWVGLRWKMSPGQDCLPTDAGCGVKVVSFDQVQSDAISTSFAVKRNLVAASGQPDGTIAVDSHVVWVKWGSLLSYLIQKDLFPNATKVPADPSPVLDSQQKLLGAILGGSRNCLVKDSCCDDFVLGAAGSGIAASVLGNACSAATAMVQTAFDAKASALDQPAETGLELSADACPVLDTDGDGVVDALGSADLSSTAKQCMWTVKLAGGGAAKSISTRFFATRQQ